MAIEINTFSVSFTICVKRN